MDVPGQWQCATCGALRCWPTRNQCFKCGQPRSAGSSSHWSSTYFDTHGAVGGMPQGFPSSSFFGGGASHGPSSSQVLGPPPLNPGMVHGPLGHGPPFKRSQTPPTSRRGPNVSLKPPLGAGTGYVRFDEGPLLPPPAPLSVQPVNQVLPAGPPACCAAPLPVGPVV